MKKTSQFPLKQLVVRRSVALAICMLTMLLVGFGLFKLYENTPKESFYQNSGDWDAYYIPLVKPYKAVRLVQGVDWDIELYVAPTQKDMYYYLHINDVNKIAVKNKVIMVYAPNSILLDEDEIRIGQKVLPWFVIVPDKKIEIGFDNEDGFLKYIQEYGIKEPAWENPDSIFQKFQKTGCLDWIPNCKQ
jgi:hypothetical protein